MCMDHGSVLTARKNCNQTATPQERECENGPEFERSYSWLAAFMRCEWPMLRKNGWPMLLKYAEANAFNTSGAYNEFPKWGVAEGGRPHLGWGGQTPPSLCAPLASKALASAYFKSIGQLFFQKRWPSIF
jgi:hypothetical protein